MPYFKSVPGYYEPNEYSDADYQEYERIGAEYLRLHSELMFKQTRIDRMKEELEQLVGDQHRASPIYKSYYYLSEAFGKSLDSISRDTLRYRDSDYADQATSIQEACKQLKGILGQHLVLLADVERVIDGFSTFSERQEGDLATWFWYKMSQEIIPAQQKNLEILYQGDQGEKFALMIMDSFAQKASTRSYAALEPSAPAYGAASGYTPYPGSASLGGWSSESPHQSSASASGYTPYQDSLYPSTDFLGTDVSEPQYNDPDYGALARELEGKLELERKASELEPEAQVLSEEKLFEVFTSIEGQVTSGLVVPGVAPEVAKGLRGVRALCDYLKGEMRRGTEITILYIYTVIPEITTLTGYETISQVKTLMDSLLEGLRPKPPAPTISAPNPSGSASYPSLSSFGVVDRQGAVDKFLGILDTYVLQRAQVKDATGATAEYQTMGAVVATFSFLAPKFVGKPNSFTEEKEAIACVTSIMRKEGKQFTADEIAKHKAVLGKGGPFAVIQKFVSGNPAQIITMFTTVHSTDVIRDPQAFINELFASALPTQGYARSY